MKVTNLRKRMMMKNKGIRKRNKQWRRITTQKIRKVMVIIEGGVGLPDRKACFCHNLWYNIKYWEWVAFPFSGGSSQPRNWTQVSCIAGRFFTSCATGGLDHQKNKRVPQKHLLCLIDYAKDFAWITTNCGKFLKRWEYQTTWPAPWEISMQVRKQQLELDMEHQTGSRSGKEYVKVVYCDPAYLTYMQSTSCEMLDWMKHKLESKLPGEISITSDTQLSAEELMLLNCGVGEDSWESLGLQGGPTSPS